MESTKSAPQLQPAKKPGFFKSNKTKIARVMMALTNIAMVVGICIVGLLHIINPAMAVISIPSLITLFMQWVAKFEPEKLQDVKNLLLEKLKDEKDVEVINKVYDEVMSTCSGQVTQRTQQPSQANSEQNARDLPEARMPALYREYEDAIQTPIQNSARTFFDTEERTGNNEPIFNDRNGGRYKMTKMT